MSLASPLTIRPSIGLTADAHVEQIAEHPLATQHNTASISTRASDEPSPADIDTRVLESIHRMIRKYDYGWETVQKELKPRVPPQKERVVVTGSTGALGSYLLANLLEDDTVEKVWALNRSSRRMEERQRISFADKGLDVDLLKNEKLVLVEADLEGEKLGLGADLYKEIQSTATIIIHNAWQINFNMTLELLEPSIKGIRNLLDFAFSSTASAGLPRFVFTSSFAAGFGKLGNHLKERYLRPEDAATSNGYGQSKFVAEKLLELAREAGLETCIVRLGQLTGDVDSGSWSVNHWVPLIIASSASIGCLPGAVGNVSWIPLTTVARSIIDISTSCGGLIPPVVHPSHPYPIQWSRMFAMFAEGLGAREHYGRILPVVPFNEWNERVKSAALAFEGSQSDRFRRFPSTKIQGTMEALADADQKLRSQTVDVSIEAVGFPLLDTSEAERLSETLRSTAQLCEEHVEKWIGYWAKMGLFYRDKAKLIYGRL
ncbi:hypothetical protein FRC07_004316 [Ceratobasidium sp. 392]|nr:hypothetical protein FRC07_004316 [Ceratobasidium sp. 392]